MGWLRRGAQGFSACARRGRTLRRGCGGGLAAHLALGIHVSALIQQTLDDSTLVVAYSVVQRSKALVVGRATGRSGGSVCEGRLCDGMRMLAGGWLEWHNAGLWSSDGLAAGARLCRLHKHTRRREIARDAGGEGRTSLSLASVSAPLARSASTMRAWPDRAAIWRTVMPSCGGDVERRGLKNSGGGCG
jgi:hypothetical protein